MRRVIDLTHVISAQTPVWRPWMAVRVEPVRRIAEHGSAHNRLGLDDHCGSHLDAPAHMLPGGAGVEALDPADLLGPAACVDLRDKGPDSRITADDLRIRCPELGRARRLLLATGWDARFDGPGFFEGFPSLSLDAAELLAQGPLALLGLDTPSPGPMGEEGRAIHRVLMSAGVAIAEALKNLTMLPEKGFEIAVLPLPILHAGGAPCRAVAWL